MFGVVSGICDANRRHSNRDSDEIVIVEIEKVSVPGHVVSLGRHPAIDSSSAADASAPLKKTVPLVGGRYKIARSDRVCPRVPNGGHAPAGWSHRLPPTHPLPAFVQRVNDCNGGSGFGARTEPKRRRRRN